MQKAPRRTFHRQDDRLARNVNFFSGLMNSDVEFVAGGHADRQPAHYSHTGAELGRRSVSAPVTNRRYPLISQESSQITQN
jgi:hypothetical protein